MALDLLRLDDLRGLFNLNDSESGPRDFRCRIKFDS